MWIRLPAWMLADEEPSLPAAGDLLAGIGIRAYGTPAAAPGGAADGIEEVLVDPGSRARLRSKLTAIGGYEWEAFGLTDTRTDWTAHEVAVLDDGDAMVRVTPVS